MANPPKPTVTLQSIAIRVRCSWVWVGVEKKTYKGNPCHALSSTNMIRFMSQTLQTSNSTSYSINMIISCPDIMDRTKPYNSFDETTYGPTSTPLSSNSAAHARLAKELRLPDINLTDSSNNCPFWKDRGTQFLWTL